MTLKKQADFWEFHSQKIKKSSRRCLVLSDIFKEAKFKIELHPERSRNRIYQPIRKICEYLENFFYTRSINAREKEREIDIMYWDTIRAMNYTPKNY